MFSCHKRDIFYKYTLIYCINESNVLNLFHFLFFFRDASLWNPAY
ncbi:hypothetical protein M124_0623 [Bacteroides fragilis str. 3988T(B)14]|uniref:Uncharacterized protein n=2 Tax=Bacteroides fragilis TaxID=817 RepID=A0A015X816_BACFG|nr:hypothetical protein M117_0658 [Bacteroides fragilis str. 3774 T13]EXY61776.1 hypothetical protein M111_0656 [Bacteroides fragilis str. 3986T(B)10]EXY75544.1 hypothetical protein M124_0623 [Bacteroides fragilis str. 3988T(B)14]EXY81553.1 hypothetical protein M084_0673 [Bacteroides fragilis str. 3988 T1]EXZ20884.1 hypothetical protein M067_0716 [Bacteroides fragilis str. J-143-4]EXZ30150.1 hypothetical protein M136_0686 [Bacteroides fragilis str. S36L11]EXZ50472.1 hypothetical protein M109_